MDPTEAADWSENKNKIIFYPRDTGSRNDFFALTNASPFLFERKW